MCSFSEDTTINKVSDLRLKAARVWRIAEAPSFFLTTIFPTTIFWSSIDKSAVLPADIWKFIARKSDLLRIQALAMVSSSHAACVALVDRVAFSRHAGPFAMH
jgi:hypothetical protein